VTDAIDGNRAGFRIDLIEDSVITSPKTVAPSRTLEFFAPGWEWDFLQGADFSHDPVKLDALDAANISSDGI
jgi:hypothetical protein